MNKKQSIILLSDNEKNAAARFAGLLCSFFNRKLLSIGTGDTDFDHQAANPGANFIENLVETFDPVLFVFDYSPGSSSARRRIKKLLLAFRELRIPYIGVNSSCQLKDKIEKVCVPVGFLPEEKEKAPWSNSFIKYCQSDIILVKPKDRGSRATKNVSFIEKFLKTQHNTCQTIQGTKSSFKIEFEALKKYGNSVDMYMISASRAYGLDDNLLGPKEYHVLKNAQKPVLIINPRDDIYVLCGD